MGEIERPSGPHRSQIVQIVQSDPETKEPIFHYPMTVVDAVKTSDGADLNQVLNDKLKELGQDVVKEVDKRVTVAVNSQLSSYEASIAYLAANYLRGVIKLPLGNLASVKERKYFYLDPTEFYQEHADDDAMPEFPVDEYIPAEDLVANTIYALSTDRAKIYQRVSGSWELMSENERIILYGLLVPDYLGERNYVNVSAGSGAPDRSTLKSEKGDIYFDTATDTPYICIGSTWVNALQSQAVDAASASVLSPIVDLVSCRYVTISSSGAGEINYSSDTETVTITGQDDVVTGTLRDFVIALFRENLASKSEYKLYFCPKTPTEAEYGDLWINQRSPSILYRNMGLGTNTVSWSPSGSVSTDINLILDNLISGSDLFDARNDLTWVDVLTGSPAATEITSVISGYGVQALVGENVSISKIVDIQPDTWYTYSCKLRPISGSSLPTIKFVAEGCYIANTSHPDEEPLSTQDADSDGFVTYWMLVGTDNITTKSIMCITASGGDGALVHSVCLRQGSAKSSWTASLSDVVSQITPVFQKLSAVSIIYRDQEESTALDNSLQILGQGSVVNTAVRGSWTKLSPISSELSTAINDLYSPYSDAGTTRVYTQHSTPASKDAVDGDIWVKDDLSVVRKIGNTWINSSSLLAGIQKSISTHVNKNTDVIMRNLFLDTSINPSDIFDLAALADPTIKYYEQVDEPKDAKVGDIWFDTDRKIIFRYNGSKWVIYGPAQLSDITQTVQGFESDVAAIYEDGSGTNLLNNSESINIAEDFDLYSPLEFNTKYVLSIEGSSSTTPGMVYFTARVTDQDGNGSYNVALLDEQKQFLVSQGVAIWRIVTPKKEDVNSWVQSLKIRILTDNQITLRRVKLAKGQIYSPWDSSNSDKESLTDDKLSDLDDRLSNTESDINGTAGSISSTNAQLNSISANLANAINIANTALSQSVVVQQSASALAITAASTVQRVSETESQLKIYASVFEFTSVGLKISSKEDGQTQRISTYYRSNGLYIYDEVSASDIAYFTDEGMKIINGEIENQLRIGNFLFVPRSGGGMSLVYAG